jgi:sortase (surface protein transpeptidase)
MMKLLRAVAIVSFIAGISVLVYGFVRSGETTRPASVPTIESFTPVATPLPPDADVSATPSTTTPSATPVPYNGAVTRFKIPRFKVDSPIEGIGLGPDNRLETPRDPHNTGWYTNYDRPGAPGNAVFSAHVDYWPDILGPFFNLAKMERGDEVVIQMDDGRLYKYRVIAKQRFDVSDIPMGDLIWPKTRPKNAEWITLITCGGRFQASREGGPGEYLDRDVVVAERFE